MQEATLILIPEFRWEIPVSSSTLRSEDFKRTSLKAAQDAIFELTGVDFTTAPFSEAVSAIGQLEGSEHFAAATTWLLGMRHFDVASQPIEIQQELPLWFWEAVLDQVQRVTRFEALRYVGSQSFEEAIERWANKPEGVSLSAINYWRKKRSDEWGMLPEHTFLALYS